MGGLILNTNYAFPSSVLAVLLLFLSVNTIPLNLEENGAEIDDFVVSSGNLKLNREGRDTQRSAKFKNHQFGNWTKFKKHDFGNWTKFNWENYSIFDKLDEMMASIERDLEELLNDTISYTDFLKNSETFADMGDTSFSFAESASFSASESVSGSATNEELEA